MGMRVAVGVGAVVGVVLLATQVPEFVGGVLLGFSVLLALWACLGLIRPDLARYPNHLASVWIAAVAFGFFLAGGALLAVDRSDSPPVVEESEERSTVNARVLCMQEVERVGAYQYRWTAGLMM